MNKKDSLLYLESQEKNVWFGFIEEGGHVGVLTGKLGANIPGDQLYAA